MRIITGLKKISHALFKLRWVDTIGQDIRYGVRGLKKNPALVVVAVLSLALGISANLTLYSLIQEVLPRSGRLTLSASRVCCYY